MVSTRILGPDGQPITLADLDEPQTSRLISLQHEFQGHPSRGLTPSRLASIMDAAEQGDLIAQSDLFEDIEEKDGHVAAEMGKRRRAVLGLEWSLVPPKNPIAAEKAATEQLYDLLQGLDNFEQLLFDVTDAIGKGFANIEIEWHQQDGYWQPKSFAWRPQSWFQIERGYQQEIRLRGPVGGVPLQPFGWITHVHPAKSGYLERSALFRVLAWPYLFKNYSVGDLAEFLEIYGIPMRVGKYPGGATEKEKLTLLRALSQLGHNAAGIIPTGMELDFLKAADGDPDAFALMIDWCERTQSKAILGGTLTSQADGASSTNALGNVHNEVRLDLRDSDALLIAKTLSRDLVYSIGVLNGLVSSWTRCPRIRFDCRQPEDLTTYATALPPLVALGLQIPRQWAQERLGIPAPDGDEPLLGTSSQAPQQALTRIAALSGINRADPNYQSTLSDTDRLDTQLQPVLGDWIDQIRQLVADADSLEQIRDGLIKLVPDMTLDQYAEAMTQALATAALQGRFDIVQEGSS